MDHLLFGNGICTRGKMILPLPPQYTAVSFRMRCAVSCKSAPGVFRIELHKTLFKTNTGKPDGLPGCSRKEPRETSNRHAKARVHLTAHVTTSHAVEACLAHGVLLSFSYLFDILFRSFLSF